MLQVLRNSVASIFAKILFGLLVLSFAIWGMGDIFTGGFFGSDTVAEVGKEKISATRLENEYRRELNRLRSMNIDPERARQLGVMDRLLQSMVSRATFDAEVGELGFTASDRTVAESIRTNPAFQNELNQFDRVRFEQLLQANGISQTAYEEDLRRDIARTQVIDSIAGNTRIPKPVADMIYGWREEKRIAAVTNVPVDQTAKVPEPSAEELAAYHKEQTAEFTAPERRAVQFVHLSPTGLANSIDVPEEKLKELFAERRNDFITQETRKVLQLVVADQAEAKAAAQRIEAGEAFAEVAKNVSGQSAEGIDLGEIARTDLPEDLATKVFALEPGKVSQPVQGPFGWHIFKVEKVNASKEPSFEEVRDRLKAEVAGERAIEEIYQKANRLEDAIGAGSSLQEAASGLGLELHKVPAVDRQGRDAEGKPIGNLPGPPFLETIFSQPVGEPGTMIETRAGGFFIARVEAVMPSEIQPLDKVRDAVVEAWKRARRVDLAEKQAEIIKAALVSGTPIADVPESPSKSLERTQPFTRENGAAQTGLPFQIVDDLFKFDKLGNATTAFAGDRFVVAQLAQIVPADSHQDGEGYRSMAMNLNSSLTSDLLIQFNRALQAEHDVTINERLLGKLTGTEN